MTHTTIDYDALLGQLTPPVVPPISHQLQGVHLFRTYTEYGIAMDSWIEKVSLGMRTYSEELEKFNTAKEKILAGFYNDLEKVYGFSAKLGSDIWPVLEKLISEDYSRLGSLNVTFTYVARYAELIGACTDKHNREIKVRTIDRRDTDKAGEMNAVLKTIQKHFDRHSV